MTHLLSGRPMVGIGESSVLERNTRLDTRAGQRLNERAEMERDDLLDAERCRIAALLLALAEDALGLDVALVAIVRVVDGAVRDLGGLGDRRVLLRHGVDVCKVTAVVTMMMMIRAAVYGEVRIRKMGEYGNMRSGWGVVGYTGKRQGNQTGAFLGEPSLFGLQTQGI